MINNREVKDFWSSQVGHQQDTDISSSLINSRLFCNYNEIQLNKDRTNNIFQVEGKDREFMYLNPQKPGNRGGHSFVFKLYNEELDETKIIKVSNVAEKYDGQTLDPHPKNKRFYREVQALLICKQLSYVINISSYGLLRCRKKVDGKPKPIDVYYPYYVMEQAECDLTTYIEVNQNMNLRSKLEIIIQIISGIEDLHQKGIYHRDIKPDNIFKIYGKSEWKIGDLGLIQYRDNDFIESIDKTNEFIGPRGWISPEVMNKFLTEEKYGQFDCKIDDKSDVFQLGKVFWFILQGNVPIGTVSPNDFLVKNDQLFSVIKNMLNHNKKKRYSLSEVVKIINKIYNDCM